jgi:hypothetical protein
MACGVSAAYLSTLKFLGVAILCVIAAVVLVFGF